jgi:hypothetical protein
LAPLRGAILLRAARAKYLYEYRKVAPFLVCRQRHRGCGARVFDALDLEPMEDATDEETYNLLLQLKELRCARLQVRVTHVLARSHLLPLTPRCTPTLSLLRRR